jgi:DNA repair exonuclease SbcCD ATPase subunit
MSELDKINSAFLALQNAGRAASEQLQTVVTLTEELATTFAKAKTLDDQTIKALCDAVLSAADVATHDMSQPTMACRNLAFVSRKLVRAILGDKSAHDESNALPVAQLTERVAELEKQLEASRLANRDLSDRNKDLSQKYAARIDAEKVCKQQIEEAMLNLNRRQRSPDSE